MTEPTTITITDPALLQDGDRVTLRDGKATLTAPVDDGHVRWAGWISDFTSVHSPWTFVSATREVPAPKPLPEPGTLVRATVRGVEDCIGRVDSGGDLLTLDFVKSVRRHGPKDVTAWEHAKVVVSGEREGDASDVEAGRCCPACRASLTEHNRAVWEAGYSLGYRHADQEPSR